MTLDIDTHTEPPRNGRGQYLVPDPDHPEERNAYTRATTVAKAPEDQGGLIKWGQRMVAIGMGRRADLVALAASTDPDDKRALGKIAAEAEEAGGASAARNTGTAVHAAIEAVNRGHEPLPLFAAEVDAYRAALDAAGMEPVPELVERVVALHGPRIAGTFDVALRHRDTGELYVADLKTGSVAYPAAMAIQLAIYATADDLLSADYERLEPVPKWSTERGIIIHLPEGGPCSLHWIDLEMGRRGLAVALSVRGWRKDATAKRLLSPVESPEPTESRTTEWLLGRYAAVLDLGVDKATVAASWPAGVPGPKRAAEWDAADIAEVARVLERIEKAHGAPFPPPDPDQPPTPPRRSAPAKVIPLRERPADGDDADPAAVAELRERFAAMDETDKTTTKRWVLEGARAGRDWNMAGSRESLRRFAVSAAAVELAPWGDPDGDDAARALIAAVIGEDACQRHPVGALLGVLTAEEAETLARIAAAAEPSTFRVTEGGEVTATAS